MLVTRIIFLCFQNDENLQLFTYCHSEKTENLAFSVDFRLIQNLSMLIEVSLSEITLAGLVSRPTSAQSD